MWRILKEFEGRVYMKRNRYNNNEQKQKLVRQGNFRWAKGVLFFAFFGGVVWMGG